MKGDFLGFSFNGIHSSQLGFTRVSGGDRYNEALFPDISDRSSEIVGGDGELYFGSEYRGKPFSINIAFDSMTELQFRKIRRLFGTKDICELIFDERPYKVYYVKLAGPIELEYVCFDEEDYTWEKIKDEETQEYYKGVTGADYEYKNPTGKKRRIYKGEGTIELVAYYPFAKQLYKVLDYYKTTNSNNLITTYDNVDEWAESSGILDLETYNNNHIDQTLPIPIDMKNYNLKIPVYNPGDLNTGFYLYIPFGDNGKIEPQAGDYIKIGGDNNTLVLNTITRKGSENGIMINTVNHLIEGVIYDPITEREDHRKKTWITTRNIYNEAIEIGDFPKILRSDWYFDTDQFKQAVYLNCKIEEGMENHIQINYDYLYF